MGNNSRIVDNVSVINNEYMCYVEPNAIGALSRNGLNGTRQNFEFSVPLEDLSLFVALKVEMKGTTIGGKVKSTDDTSIMMTWTPTDKNETVNLHRGTKFYVRSPKGNETPEPPSVDYLSTEYTNTHYMDIVDNGTSEMFGIESINIAYNNFMVPTVDMEFTDVKGVSLFAPEELRHNATYKGISGVANKDIAGSFFKAFFTTPYPKFTLYVKGFYGQPVSYELMCQDFRADFEPKTGNFKAKANFVGYSFAFLNDIVMNALIAAPYSDYLGQYYWYHKKKTGDFTVTNEAGAKVPMPTLVEIIDTVKKLRETENEKAALATSSDEYLSIAQCANESEAINVLLTVYSNYRKNVADVCKKANVGSDFGSLGNTEAWGGQSLVLLVSNSTTKVLNELIPDSTTEKHYNKLVQEIEIYNSSYGQKIKAPEDAGKKKPEKVLALVKKSSKKYKVSNKTLEKELKKDTELKDALDSIIDAHNNEATEKKDKKDKKPKENKLSTYTIGYILYGYDFVRELNKRQEEIAKTDSEAQSKAAKSLEKRAAESKQKQLEKISAEVYTADAIGFKPTVENVIRVVVAHIETFVYCIMSTAESIENESPHRTVKSLEGKLENFSDLEATRVSDDTQVPPFPRVSKLKQGKEDKAPVREDAWIGDMPGDYLEEDLINGLVNGVLRIAKMTETKSSGSKDKEDVSTTQETVMKIPLTPLDLMLNDIPYGNSISFNTDFAGRVVMRAMEVLGLPHFNISSTNGWQSLADDLGKADAVNFSTFFTEADSTFKKRLSGKTLTADNILKMVTNSKDKATKKERDSEKWAWDFPKDSENSALITASGDNYLLDHYKTSDGNVVIPIQGSTFDEINTETSEGTDAPKTDKYICTKSSDDNAESEMYIVFDSECAKYREYRDKGMMFEGKTMSNITKFYERFNYDRNRYNAYLINCGPGDNNITDRDYPIAKKFTVCAFNENKVNINFDAINGTRFLPEKKRDMTEIDTYAEYGQSVFRHTNNKYTPLGDGNERFWTLAYHPDGDFNMWEYYTASQRFLGLSDFLKTESADITDFEISWFCGIDYTGALTETASIFGQEFYYGQTNDKVKAYLFLRSLSFINMDVTPIRNLINSAIDIVPKVYLLFIGGVLWKNLNRFGDNGYNAVGNFMPKQQQFEADIVQMFSTNIRPEITNTFIKFFTDWVASDFKRLVKPYELNFTGKGGSKEFFEKILTAKNYTNNPQTPVICDDYINASLMGCSSFEALFTQRLSDDFFKNYLSVAERVDVTNWGIRLINRPTTAAMAQLMGDLFTPHTVIVTTRFIGPSTSGSLSVPKSVVKKYLTSFLTQLKKQYKKDDLEQRGPKQRKAKRAAQNDISPQLKIGIYKYVKALYDRWLATGHFSRWTVPTMMDGDEKYFHFIDTFYNYTGHLTINVGKLADRLMDCQNNKDVSLLTFLSLFLADGNFLLLYVQNYKDLSKYNAMVDMFKPIGYTDMTIPRSHPDFIVMHNNDSATQLDTNVNKPSNSFMINDKNESKLPESIRGKNNKNGDKIPAFGVSYGKQYQNYFADVSLDMANSMVTEQSIKALFEIAGAHNENGGESGVDYLPVGQDLYTIYTNNSYTCNVTMLGCAWVQPLMYFTLLNIPMWRGTYRVYQVKHNLRPGNMETTFTGCRMAGISNPQREEWLEKTVNNQHNTLSMGGKLKTKKATTLCGYNVYPISFETRERFILSDLNATWKDDKTALDGIAQSIYLSLHDIKDNSLDELEVKLLATAIYNRACHSGNNILAVLNSGDIVVESSEVTYDDAQMEKIKSWAAEIFLATPSIIEGTRTNVPKKYNIWVPKGDGAEASGRKTEAVTLDTSSLSRIFYNTPVSKYGVKGSDGKFYIGQTTTYLFQHESMVYTASKDNTTFWKNDTTDVTAKMSYDQSTMNNLSVLAWNFVIAVQNSVDSADIGEPKVVVLPESKDNSLWLSLEINSDSETYKRILLFDIILNGYYDCVEELVWIPTSSNTPTAPPIKVFVRVNKSVGKRFVYMGDEVGTKTSVYALSDLDTTINPNFLGILGKKYLSLPQEVTLAECLNFSKTSDYEKLAEMMTNNESCAATIKNFSKNGATPTDEGNGGGGNSDDMIGDWNVKVALDYINGNLDGEFQNNSQNVVFGIIAGMLGSPKANMETITPIYNKYWRPIVPDELQGGVLEGTGWELLTEFSKTEGNNNTPSKLENSQNLKKGDVVLFQCGVKAADAAASNSQTSMWDGFKWVSMFSDNPEMYAEANRGPAYKKGRWKIYRYSGSGMAEYITAE